MQGMIALVMLGLAGCAASPAPTYVIPAERADEARRALEICNARGRMASVQSQYAGASLSGAIVEAANQQAAGNAVATACWEGYYRSGAMPSL